MYFISNINVLKLEMYIDCIISSREHRERLPEELEELQEEKGEQEEDSRESKLWTQQALIKPRKPETWMQAFREKVKTTSVSESNSHIF